jgi:hypothetical protein
LGKLGLTWSCNAKANVPLRDAEGPAGQWPAPAARGIRVREPADSHQHQERRPGRPGPPVHQRLPGSRHHYPRHLIVGLPGETTETIQETIRFAKEINPHSLQVSIAAPYPGTALYRQARENGWLPEDDAALIDERGVQAAALSYPNLNRTEIYDSVESFYRQFYFRAGKIAEMSAEMLRSPGMMRRRPREGAEFISFLRRRDSSAS